MVDLDKLRSLVSEASGAVVTEHLAALRAPDKAQHLADVAVRYVVARAAMLLLTNSGCALLSDIEVKRVVGVLDEGARTLAGLAAARVAAARAEDDVRAMTRRDGMN